MQVNILQGSPEWHLFRSKHINSTDCAPILGVSPYKSATVLWEEKLGLREREPMNEKMQRGVELEDQARQCLSRKIGIPLKPAVFEHGERKWQAASLDGYDMETRVACEIKCGQSAYNQALKGIIAEYYRSQLQHIMSVCDLSFIHYFCYLSDEENVLITVYRDDDYIRNMIEKEFEFWQGLQSLTPPPQKYIERTEEKWMEKVQLWKEANQKKKEYEELESSLRRDLIEMSGESCSKGGGVKVSKIVRKGNVDYNSMIEKYNITDAESFRKPAIVSWRIESE